MSVLSQARSRVTLGSLIFISVVSIIWMLQPSAPTAWPLFKAPSNVTAQLLKDVTNTSQHFVDHPLPSSAFAEMGKRVQMLRDWITIKSGVPQQEASRELDALSLGIEQAAISMFPFIKNPSNPQYDNHLASLQARVVPGSRGVVIVTGIGTFRYACHLISSLRNVLHSTLPIQVAYAGDQDLPSEYRNIITSLGSDIKTFDVLTVVDDTTLQLSENGWAVKAFAALTSTFEQLLLMDADAVFIQKPEVIFDSHPGYIDTGALLFHDRLLWKGAFKERHEWWEKELKGHTPSATLNKSLVYNDGYAEEGDSGVVALDKGRLSVFLGLLHICWQNTFQVRKDFTYTMCYGDKESWWFGFELSDAEYAFEDHYGSILGWTKDVSGNTKVCGFTIAHVDKKSKLLWYNGSLLRNKAVNKQEFEVPSHWMMDATWEKGATKPDISCMRDGVVQTVTEQEQQTLSESVEAAKKVDQLIKGLVET
ncbi:hypothetical protein MMC06_001432 [Schaereria dolodes]|nr:hypothetical protein [Schaereria dolodes]